MGRVMWNVMSEKWGGLCKVEKTSNVKGGVLLGPVALVKKSYKKLLIHTKVRLQGCSDEICLTTGKPCLCIQCDEEVKMHVKQYRL
jgi:hypothetical protein